jgi:hypothetical protein
MVEPTITQNSALYFAHRHAAIDKAARRRLRAAFAATMSNFRRRTATGPINVMRPHLGQR